MISVGILGGSGYAGKKLIQFCSEHPYVGEYKIYGYSSAFKNLDDIFPELCGIIKNSTIGEIDNLSDEHDLFFIALPNGEALNYVPGLFAKGKKIIDLGGDYRLNSAEQYNNWYKKEHNSPDLLSKKIYGLADSPETEYSNINLIANPGCYPTGALLSLIPLVKHFCDNILSISISAYSGTSGAGKTPKQELMMSEMDGDVSAYKLNNHQHQPEILQQLSFVGYNSPFSFATHLLPAAVGIYTSSFIHLKNKIDEEELLKVYQDFYSESSFIRLRKVPPHLSWLIGSNFCDINISLNEKVLIITAAIDNLIKGASGQAIQNMNKLFDWDEKLGILNQGVKDVQIY